MSKNSLLILGGTGFIGLSILNFFIKNKKKLPISSIILASRRSKKLKKNVKFKNNVKFLELDLLKVKNLPDANFIIYAASSSNINLYKSKNSPEYRNSIKGIINFFKILKKNINTKKVIFISSGAVYGKLKVNNPAEENQINITTRLRSINFEKKKKFYALSKIYSERIFEKEIKKTRFSGIVARCFSFIGPNIPRKSYFLIGNILEGYLKKKQVEIKSTDLKNTIKSFLFQEEMSKWLLKLLFATSVNFEVFNVGSDVEISIKKILIFFRKKYKIKFNFLNKQGNDKYDFYIPSISKIKKKLKIKSVLNFQRSVKLTINMIKNNKYIL